MSKLYKLSSEQLSQQDHYDFGMRAVKSVLVMAGSLKRATPDLAEEIILIRAIQDSNLPKFLAHDIPIFNAIVDDLFPNAKVPKKDQKLAIKRLKDQCLAQNIIPTDPFI